MGLPNRMLAAAGEYAAAGWGVFPGGVPEGRSRFRWRGRQRCSCGDPDCPDPAAHPLRPEWVGAASTDPGRIRGWWGGRRRPNILLPTGWRFDVWEAEP